MKLNRILFAFTLLSFCSLQAVAGNEVLSVRVELFEDMPTTQKSPKKDNANEATGSDAVGPVNDDAVEPEEATVGDAVGSVNDDAIEPEVATAGDEIGPVNDDAIKTEAEQVNLSAPLKDPDKVYQSRAFGFHRLPFKYDETGVRELHKGPILFRAAATLTLEKGAHRILIRMRNDAKFMMDGEVLATLKALPTREDGHNLVQELPELVSPTIKHFAPGNVEQVVSLDADGLPHTFTLETVVGHSKRRPDTGVLAVAIAGPGEDTFTLLGSNGNSVFSNEGWAGYVEDEEARYVAMDARERKANSSKETEYWQKRHAHAKAWVSLQEQVAPPTVSTLIPVHNAVDRFIGRLIEEAALRRKDRESAERNARLQGLVLFDKDIQPILEDNCLKCHGEQEKGDLRLDSQERALRGGKSGKPAYVAGHPEKSQAIEFVTSNDELIFMPPTGRRLSEQEIDLFSRWIQQGAQWEVIGQEAIAPSRHASAAELKSTGLSPLPLTGDLAFLRRVTLDTVGVIPSLEEIEAFQANTAENKRSRVIDRLMRDPRWADHWVPFWQDILAENPNIVKPNLNNTGAFRWWIHESFVDNKPMDQFVTDLVLMRGDKYVGPAGFGIATQNDVPMAAKAHILAGAFMGVQMKCARCHDAPFQSVKQKDLFSIAAMLERKPVAVPASSSVPLDKLAGRNALVQVTLKPGASVDPEWPFHNISESPLPNSLLRKPEDPRQMLAAHISSPANTRFAKAMANWVWKRYFGKGLIEPAVDWENADITHPELLDYLAQELVGHDYDIKHVCRLILNSHTYQRAVLHEKNAQAAALFVGHSRRRMTAEQILDSLHVATDSRIHSEELNMDLDGVRSIADFINLGTPRRAWEFTSLSNERDRPSLTLPHAQVYTDVLEAYGWNGSRQNPTHERDHETNVLQPATLANGIMSQRLTRLSDDHPLTELVMETREVEKLVDILFLKTLSRHPAESEQKTYTALLYEGYDQRIIPEIERARPREPRRYPYVSWSNHLSAEASEVKSAIARDIEAGAPPTRKLQNEWRKNMEDGLWALINSPEMVFVP